MRMKTVNINDKFALILLCAVRYGLGRRTYITDVISSYIKPLIPALDTKDLILIKADIDRQKEDKFTDKPLGDKCDEEAWLSLEVAIDAELKKREVK